MELVRYADRPDLRAIRQDVLGKRTFAEYLHHNPIGNRYWPLTYEAFPDFQLGLLDGDDLVAELHCAPLAWDGSLDDLPSGWEDGLARSFDDGRVANALHALAISVLPERQGEGLGARMLDAMTRLAREHELRALIACVRPTRKSDYPLIPIERYAEWRRADGSHFDPWVRLHERARGRILVPAPESFRLEAPVSDWEAWTGMELPSDGDYVVPGMLAPLVVRDGAGRHAEPNIWIEHSAGER
jgi:GNAT superfamily N-acetyltransferase